MSGLAEYNESLEVCRRLLSEVKAIAANTGVDITQLAELDTEAPELASISFLTPDVLPMVTILALKEAYDFTVAHSRLTPVEALNRADYYNQAAELLTTEEEPLDVQEAVLRKLLEYAGV